MDSNADSNDTKFVGVRGLFENIRTHSLSWITTVAARLTHWRATTLGVKPAMRELYEDLSRKHLEPAPFGSTRLGRPRLKPVALCQ